MWRVDGLTGLYSGTRDWHSLTRSHKNLITFLENFFWSDLSLSPLSVQSPFGVQCSTLTARATARVGVGRGTQDSKSYWVYRIFFLRKCFIPRREMHSISSRGPIVFTYVLFGVGRGKGGSKPYRVYRVFFLRKCFIVTGWRTGGRVDG